MDESTSTDETLARLRAGCSQEPYPKLLGIEVIEIRAGYAEVAMQFTPEMENIFGMLHGGAVFSLLDEAFQLACNAKGELSVAQNINIYFLAAARPGARLIGQATEQHATRRTALYEAIVFEESDGRQVATAQALAYRTGRALPLDDRGRLQGAGGEGRP